MKQTTAGFLLALLLIGCRQPDAENETLVRRYFDHFNRHDWKAMAAMYAAAARFRDPSLGPGIVAQSRAQVVAKYSALQQEIPDIRDSICKLYPAGPNHIVAEFVSLGTLPGGSRLSLPICTIFTLRNGLITEDYTYYDQP